MEGETTWAMWQIEPRIAQFTPAQSNGDLFPDGPPVESVDSSRRAIYKYLSRDKAYERFDQWPTEPSHRCFSEQWTGRSVFQKLIAEPTKKTRKTVTFGSNCRPEPEFPSSYKYSKLGKNSIQSEPLEFEKV